MTEIIIQDKYNPIKEWLIKYTDCRHYYLSQAINGKQLYPYQRVQKHTIESLTELHLNESLKDLC